MPGIMTTSFKKAIEEALANFTDDVVHTPKWQGVDVSRKPEMAMHEVLFYSLSVHMPSEDLDYYRHDIAPNLPWADQHFLERVNGDPLNPGETWKSWPYAHSANNFRDSGGQFNHNYMERYWPKLAGQTPEGRLTSDNLEGKPGPGHYAPSPLRGIRHEYADLNDLVDQLAKDPLTRQAYMPIWFPEDGSHSDRKPCTLGYHFIVRDGELHCVYYIRSCDFVRHFRDDIYLTVRLTLWLLDQLRQKDPFWLEINPGMFLMHITSLHMFRNDYLALRRNLS